MEFTCFIFGLRIVAEMRGQCDMKRSLVGFTEIVDTLKLHAGPLLVTSGNQMAAQNKLFLVQSR